MGKVRKVVLGDEESEKEQKRRAEARRETKKSKKSDESADASAPTQSQENDKAAKVDLTEEKESKKRHMRKGKGRARSSNYQKAKSMIDANKLYPIGDAVALVKKTSYTKFDGTVEMHVELIIDKKDKDAVKVIRGTLDLPHGTGRERRVVIASDAVIAELEKGQINFDVLIAEPAMMPKLAKFARTLGPKGLMPNPKAGTVTSDPKKKVEELSGGKINYKSEPDNPVVHLSIGKVSFTEKKIVENIESVIKSLGASKLKNVVISPTMGPGIRVAVV